MHPTQAPVVQPSSAPLRLDHQRPSPQDLRKPHPKRALQHHRLDAKLLRRAVSLTATSYFSKQGNQNSPLHQATRNTTLWKCEGIHLRPHIKDVIFQEMEYARFQVQKGWHHNVLETVRVYLLLILVAKYYIDGHWEQQAPSPASLETLCFGLRFGAWLGNVLDWTRWKWHHGAVWHQASRICESLQGICISMLFKAQPAIHLGFARSP